MSGASTWVILRTNVLRTLPLMRSLADAGIQAWTPVRVERRAGRGRKRREISQVEVAITPTFVFVAEADLPELQRIRALPTSPHPSFTILRHRDRIPVVSEAGLTPLRAAEDRFRLSLLKATRYRVEAGTSVHMKTGPMAGMSGVVERGTNKEMVVNFGGFRVSIASYIAGTDAVQLGEQPVSGIAA